MDRETWLLSSQSGWWAKNCQLPDFGGDATATLK
jgi:hypothetical protein